MKAQKQISSNELGELIDQRAFKRIRGYFRGLDVADIAAAFRDQSLNNCILLFRLLSRSLRAEVFSYLPFDQQEDLLEQLPDVVVTSLVNAMEPVDRTRLLEALDPDISSRIILKLDPRQRQVAWQLLSYPEESVGRMMNPHFITINGEMTVNRAIDHLRWNAARYPEEMILHIFVTDDRGRYIGDVSLASLFVADPTTQPVKNIMEPGSNSLNAFADQESAVHSFRKYDRPFIPVVDDQKTMIGVVHVENIFDAAEEEASEDIQQFGGIEALEDSYFHTNLPVLLRKRAGWLAVLFLGSTLTGEALKNYEETLQAMQYLVFFLPLIVSSGGNSGSQAASLVIRAIAIKDMELRDWFKVLKREIIVGAGLGVILGALGYGWTYLWGMQGTMSLIVFLSLIGVVLFGSIVGSMLPFALKRIGFDPAVCSSPLIASVSDVVGIIIFLNVAIYITRILGV
jgi:magnesium transporter